MKPTTLAFLSGLACAFACGVAMRIPDAGAQSPASCQNYQVKRVGVDANGSFIEVGWEPFQFDGVGMWVRKCS